MILDRGARFSIDKIGVYLLREDAKHSWTVKADVIAESTVCSTSMISIDFKDLKHIQLDFHTVIILSKSPYVLHLSITT